MYQELGFHQDLLNTILLLNHLDPWAEKSRRQAVLLACHLS